ncbi:MAG: inositol monophosphatase family protein [Myxococcota bacterium]
MDASGWLELLSEIADRSDAIALQHFRSHDLRVDRKPDQSLVTEADLAVEEAARKLVRERRPDLGVFGEETGEAGSRGSTRLIIDPIDSTANFARGIPVFATLLAIEEEHEVVAGMVSAPALSQRWRASRGGGAWCGERPLHVSRIPTLEEAQVFHGSLAGGEAVRATRRVPALLERSFRQRGFGDFWQHVLVAEGSGEIAIDPIVNPWDIAPLQLLIEEAGGRATSILGERSIYAGSLVSSNGILHDEALAVLRDA